MPHVIHIFDLANFFYFFASKIEYIAAKKVVHSRIGKETNRFRLILFLRTNIYTVGNSIKKANKLFLLDFNHLDLFEKLHLCLEVKVNRQFKPKYEQISK